MSSGIATVWTFDSGLFNPNTRESRSYVSKPEGLKSKSKLNHKVHSKVLENCHEIVNYKIINMTRANERSINSTHKEEQKSFLNYKFLH